MNKKEKTVSKSANLKCVKTTGGKYSLYSQGVDGKLSRVGKIGLSAQPFEIVHQYPGRPLVVVKKYVKTQTGLQPQLYLVNPVTGRVPEMMNQGVDKIMYDTTKNNFYFTPMTQTMDDAQYIRLMVLMLLNGIQSAELRPQNASAAPVQIITCNMSGVILPIVPAPVKKRARKKKRTGKKQLKRIVHKLKSRLPGVKKQNAGRPVMKTPVRSRIGKSALRAKITAPYSIRKDPRITYHPTITRPVAQKFHHSGPAIERMAWPTISTVSMNTVQTQNQR